MNYLTLVLAAVDETSLSYRMGKVAGFCLIGIIILAIIAKIRRKK